MTGTAHGAGASPPRRSLLPALGFALGPVFEKHEQSLAGRRRASTTSRRTPTSRATITIVAGIGEAGKTTVYVRKRNPEIDTEEPASSSTTQFIAISTRCMHLGCPVRYVDAAAALHLPVPRRRLRLPAARSPAARRCARSTASTRASRNGQVQVGPRSRVNSELQRFSPRDPGEPLDGIGQYLYPSRPSIRKIRST